MSSSEHIRFNVDEKKRFMLFLFITVLCYIIASVLIALISIKGELTPAKLRISTLVQDLILFIIPSLTIAIIITRRPADFLLISKAPRFIPVILTIFLIISMVPVMNSLVAWNESLELPESMRKLQEYLHSLENNANQYTQMLMNGTSVGNIIISVLIIGILTGFSEELYFRGTLQRLFSTGKVNIHLSIWITAFIFSAVHLQIFGFVPRLLLGALFGYLMWWSGSVWLAITAHITNNTMVVIATKIQSHFSIDFNTIGSQSTPTDKYAFWLSLGVSILLFGLIYITCRKERKINQTVSLQN